MTPLAPACEELIEHARREIMTLYSPDGPSPRAYHNITHTDNVVADVHLLATNASLNSDDNALLRLAAAYHDLVHNGDGDPDNELHSANRAVADMTAYGCFDQIHIDLVRTAILATKCSSKYPKIVQTPHKDDTFSQLLCDADLASFGKPYIEFITGANCFFNELYPELDLADIQYQRFINAEITLLSNHTFWTEHARFAFHHVKQNIQHLEQLQKSLNNHQA